LAAVVLVVNVQTARAGVAETLFNSQVIDGLFSYDKSGSASCQYDSGQSFVTGTWDFGIASASLSSSQPTDTDETWPLFLSNLDFGEKGSIPDSSREIAMVPEPSVCALLLLSATL